MMTSLKAILTAGAAAAALGSAALAPQAARAQEAQLVSTHSDWEMRCYPDNNCFLSQTQFNEDGSRAAAMNIIKLPQPLQSNEGPVVAIADVYTPLNVLLAQGLGLRIDAGAPRVVPYTICTQRGCLSKVRMLAAQVDAFKAGGKIELLLTIQSDTGLAGAAVPFSLSGFTAGYDALTPVAAPAQ